MYPLNMTLSAPAVGFALANDVSEHQALTDAGYLPAYVAPTRRKSAVVDAVVVPVAATSE